MANVTGARELDAPHAHACLRRPRRTLHSLVAERLTTLQSAQLEVTLHPSDLILAGPNREVMKARARLAERLAFSKLYMTWTADAQRLEDRLRKIWLGTEASNGHHQAKTLPAVDHDLKTAELPFEEWEVLFRKELLLERRRHGLDVGAVHELPPATEHSVGMRRGGVRYGAAATAIVRRAVRSP